MKLQPFRNTTDALKIACSDPSVIPQLTSRLIDLLAVPAVHRRPLAVVCIGTDRSTGDALGPLVGSSLHRHAFSTFHLYGTLEHPVHAMNLEQTMQDIYNELVNPYIIGIDACLGQVASVGAIQLGNGPVRPGAGVNKDLPPVGDIHLTGIVNVGGFMEYFVLQNTRLHLVMQMADVISTSLWQAISASLLVPRPVAQQE